MADACTHDAMLCQCQLDGALEDIVADLVAVRERYDALLAKNAFLMVVLEYAQWGSGDGCNRAHENARLEARGAVPDGRCPWCGAHAHSGKHLAGCLIGAALGKP